jgi:hypothetical protein
MHSILFVLAYFCIGFIRHSEAHRIKRFLNSAAHTRINVLEQAHTAHREDTSSIRNIFLGAITSVSVIIVIIIIIIVFLWYRLRRSVRERQSPALAAIQASGLPNMYPIMNALFHKLQRLDTI